MKIFFQFLTTIWNHISNHWDIWISFYGNPLFGKIQPRLPTPCWSVLDFWKINLEKSSLTNLIFSLFFTARVACKNQFRNWSLQAKNLVRRTWIFKIQVLTDQQWVSLPSRIFFVLSSCTQSVIAGKTKQYYAFEKWIDFSCTLILRKPDLLS